MIPASASLIIMGFNLLVCALEMLFMTAPSFF